MGGYCCRARYLFNRNEWSGFVHESVPIQQDKLPLIAEFWRSLSEGSWIVDSETRALTDGLSVVQRADVRRSFDASVKMWGCLLKSSSAVRNHRGANRFRL